MGCLGLVEASPDGEDVICRTAGRSYAVVSLEDGRRTPLSLDSEDGGQQPAPTLNFHWSQTLQTERPRLPKSTTATAGAT